MKILQLFCLLYRQVSIANLLVFLILQFPILSHIIEKAASIFTEVRYTAIPKKGQLRKSHQSALCNNSPIATYIYSLNFRTSFKQVEQVSLISSWERDLNFKPPPLSPHFSLQDMPKHTSRNSPNKPDSNKSKVLWKYTGSSDTVNSFTSQTRHKY